MTQQIVFVSMPFSVRKGTLYGTEFELNFDNVWTDLIRPAAPEGWTSIRIDEINEPGSIPTQYLEYLRTADVVIFDLTFGNLNVYYELGVRHASVPERSVLIAHKDSSLPFNIQHQRVLFYDSTDPASWSSFQDRLREMIIACAQKEIAAPAASTKTNGKTRAASQSSGPPDSERLRSQLSRAKNLPQLISLWNQWKGWDFVPPDSLLELGERFVNEQRVDLGVEVLARAYDMAPDEYEVARTYGWYLRKNGQMEEAEIKLLEALELNPGDLESMGMLGGLYKRQTKYKESLAQYQKAIELDRDNVYILVNLGALEFLLHPDKPELTQKWYSRVIELCESQSYDDMSIWDLLALAEAYLAVGDVKSARREYSQSIARKATPSTLQSAEDQLAILMEAGFQTDACKSIIKDILGPALHPRGVSASSGSGDGVKFTVIHLSDIHFGFKTNRATQEKKAMHRFKHGIYNKSFAEYLVPEIERLRSENPNSPIILVTSGDIAYEATKEEYREAQSFIEEVREKTGLSAEHLIFVPGNHDVNWALAKHEQEQRFDEYLYFLNDVYGEELLYKLYPYLKWNFKGNAERPNPADILAVHKLEDLNLLILGFNSCVFENEQHHYGLVGEKQLIRAKEMLNGLDPQTLRIAVLHHHVIPVENRIEIRDDEVAFDVSIVRDFALVEDHLHRLGIDVVLHGHKHMPALRELRLHSSSTRNLPSKSIVICGAGSSGVCEDELPHQTGNHMEILNFHSRNRVSGAPFMDVQWREMKYTDIAQWETTNEWTISG